MILEFSLDTSMWSFMDIYWTPNEFLLIWCICFKDRLYLWEAISQELKKLNESQRLETGRENESGSL